MALEIIESPLMLLRLTNSLEPYAVSNVWLQTLSEIQDRHRDTCSLAEVLPTSNKTALEKFRADLLYLIETGEPLACRNFTVYVAGCENPYDIYAWREDEDLPWCIELCLQESQGSDNELTRIRSEFEMILASAGEGIYGLDKNGACTFANAASTQILGWDAQEIIGAPVHDIHHHTRKDGSHYPREECFVYRALKDGETHRINDEIFWTNEGKSVPVEYISTPIIKNGSIEGAVIVFRDISERLTQERVREAQLKEIKRLKEELELERNYLREEIQLEHSFKEIIGSSPPLTRALKQLEAVADTPTSVLITGESGVGKEVFARAIHNLSSRSNSPLVKVNCASIPKDLFESEFFGHKKGAFTGADRDRVGRLQLANGGTIFLDEVGEIPFELQSKLLRALQEQEFEAVGDEKTIKVNVRVVAATNRDLLQEVKAGNFREDLYYRLSVFPIHIPPLRERSSDIPELAQHLLKKLCDDLGKPALKIRQSHAERLSMHSWPGNIRELKNVIERAIILSGGDSLRLDLAMPEMIAAVDSNKETESLDNPDQEVLTEEQMKLFEKRNLQRALKMSNGKIAGANGAAAKLGIKPSTLTYRMEKLGIERD